MDLLVAPVVAARSAAPPEVQSGGVDGGAKVEVRPTEGNRGCHEVRS
jgi:hypothetical protein